MSLRGLIHRDIRTAPPLTTLIDVARMMRQFNIGSMFIEENEKIIGIVTESDLVRKALTKGLPLDTSARLLMNAPLIEADIEKSVMEANHLMHFNGIRHLAVSEEGKVVGVLSVRDLVRHFSSDGDSPLNKMGDILKPLTVMIHRDIQTIDVSASAQAAAKKMEEKKIGSLMVAEGGIFTGMLTETDLVRKVVSYGLAASQIPVGALMNTPIIDIDVNASIQEANKTMATKGVRHLAVTEEGKIVGILSIRDLIGMISIRDLPRFFGSQK